VISSTRCVSRFNCDDPDTAQILSIFSRVSDSFSSSFFLQNIFLVLISSPSSRLAALNYLSRRLLEPPDPGVLEVGLMVRGIASALEDENVLVRRSGLDLLLRVMSLDGSVLR
jgi:hypothetical protein